MTFERPKGMRDFSPQEKILREKVIAVLKKNFEIFGFNPLETPIVEKFETLASKYAGGAEILKETFQLEDQGKRKLGLRYDLTVPFARYISNNPNIKLPFKRYQIGPVFRDGPLRTNRYRQFDQCDSDIVGTRSLTADAECIFLFLSCFEELGLDVEVRVNNRKILDEVMQTLKIKEDLRAAIILTLDKLDKKSIREVEEELASLRIDKSASKELLKFFSLRGTNADVLKETEKILGMSEGVKELKDLLSLCSSKDILFVPSLARGLSYYTGTIFEVYIKNSSVKNSIAAGGRYDQMIGNFLENNQEYPAVGCSFGLDVICDALLEKEIKKKSVVLVYVIPVGLSLEKVWDFVLSLRKEGICCDIDFNNRGISKNLNYVNAYGIPYALIIGENELKNKKFTLKNMVEGKEEKLDMKSIVKKLKN